MREDQSDGPPAQKRHAPASANGGPWRDNACSWKGDRLKPLALEFGQGPPPWPNPPPQDPPSLTQTPLPTPPSPLLGCPRSHSAAPHVHVRKASAERLLCWGATTRSVVCQGRRGERCATRWGGGDGGRVPATGREDGPAPELKNPAGRPIPAGGALTRGWRREAGGWRQRTAECPWTRCAERWLTPWLALGRFFQPDLCCGILDRVQTYLARVLYIACSIR